MVLRSNRMQVEIIDADLSNPTHTDGVIAILDSYARENTPGDRDFLVRALDGEGGD